MNFSTIESIQHPGVAAVAEALLRARRERRPADASALAGSLRDAADAYAVQAVVVAALAGAADVFPRHWKSGGPSREAVLTHAPLPPAGVWPSPADASGWPCNIRFIEAEIALRLGRDVTPGEASALTQETAPALIDAMTLSIELVDSRWAQSVDAPPLLKLADLQSHGGLCLGEWQPYKHRDWASQECTVQIGERAMERFRGTHSLGDPAWLLPTWLRHATREGATVLKGAVVTTGTWCGMLPARAGELVTVRFEGVGEAVMRL